MYNAHFNFRDSPFGVTPDLEFYYDRPAHRDALAALYNGIAARKGVFLVIGDCGSGKTSLLQRLFQRLEPDVKTAYLISGLNTESSLAQLVIDDLGLHPPCETAAHPSELLRHFLRRQQGKGNIVALLIDDAQKLGPACLLELQQLSGLELGGISHLQIVMAGRPELAAKLDHPSLSALRQRVALRYVIGPLPADEVGPYITARLQAIGHDCAELFDNEAIAAIASVSGGVPSFINLLCDHALRIACYVATSKVSSVMVAEAAADLHSAGLLAGPRVRAIAHEIRPRLPGGQQVSPSVRQKLSFLVSDHFCRVRCAVFSDRRVRWALSAVLIGLVASTGLYLRHNLPNGSGPVPDAVGRPAHPSPVPAFGTASDRGLELEPEFARAHTETVRVTGPGENGRALETHQADDRREMGSRAEKSVPDRAHSTSDRPENTTRPNSQSPSRRGSFVVVGPSFVRARPTSQSAIVATLEPGTSITITGQTGEYFRVRGSGEETIVGYVHREDAFFEPKR